MPIVDGSPALAADVNNALAALLPKAGGIMTGLLTLSADATGGLQAATFQQVQNNYLPLAGGQLTGSLTIRPSGGWASLTLNSTAGTGNQLLGYRGANLRWAMNIGDSGAESGGNVGGDFRLARYTDAGAYIDQPLVINRSNAAASFSGILYANNSIQTNYLTINGGNDALRVNAANGGYARTWWTVSGTRTWSLGCLSNGNFQLGDESAGQMRFYVDTNGNMTVQQGVYANYIASYGNMQVNGSFNSSNNVEGSWVHSRGDVQADGLLYAGNGPWVCISGNTAYRFGRDPNSGTFYTYENGTWNFQAQTNGNCIARNGMYANWIQSYGGSYSAGNDSADSFTARGNGVQYSRWTGNYVAWVWNGGGGNLQCYLDGNYIGFIFSDARVKNVLSEYEYGLAQIRRLNPIRYKLKDNTRALIPDDVEDREEKQKEALAAPGVNNPELIHVGVVAQEAETVIPEMFTRGSTMLDGERADDVRLLDNGPWLMWALVNAVKELAVKVDALEARA